MSLLEITNLSLSIHGFDILQEIHLPTAPMHWAMWRPPARSGDAPSS